MSALPNVEATVKLLGAILSGPLNLVAEKKRFQALLQDYSRRARAEQGLNLWSGRLAVAPGGLQEGAVPMG